MHTKITNFLLLSLYILFTFSLYADQEIHSQIVSDVAGESYLGIEAGTFSGISLISRDMQLQLGYSFIGREGVNISTDLMLIQPAWANFSIKTGLGGGLIFLPEIEMFSSFFYLRVPLKLEYKNFYLTGVGMFGTSMFEYELEWDLNYSISIGYKFDLYREKKVEDDKRDSEKEENE